MTADRPECRKSLLLYNSVPHCRRELFWFVPKKMAGFIFKLPFGFALFVEQFLKIEMKDASARSVQCLMC